MTRLTRCICKYPPVAVLATASVWVVCPDARAEDVFAKRWDPWLETGAQISAARSLGDADLFIPLAQDSDTLLFGDIRGMFDSQQASEGNFGIGLRQMLPTGWNIGAYGYFDLRRSSYGNTFKQITLGAEALSEQFDLRGNVYLPVGQSEAYMYGGASSSVGPWTADAVVTGGSLAIRHQAVQTTTARYEVEKALAGVDAEVGARLPVFDPGSGFDLKAFLGGYYFDGSDVDPIAGPRVRLELAANNIAGLPGVKLTGGVTYQHDNVRGDQWIAQARLRVPLQPPSVPAEPIDIMHGRMTDAVVRDVDIVSNTADVSEITNTALTTTEAAINDWNDELVTSFTQVNGAFQNGADLQAALDAANSGGVVLVSGNLSTASGITMNAGQTMLGGGAVLRLKGATSGTVVDWTAGGASGQISGSGSNLVQMGEDSFLGGLAIENLSAASGSVAVSAASGATLHEVDVTSAASGIRASNLSGFTVRGGTVSAHGGNAIELASSAGLDIQDVDIVQSGASAMGIRADNVSGQIKGASIVTHGNGNGLVDTDPMSQSSHALSISNSGGLVVADNAITTNGTQANGLFITNSAGIEISGNTITTNNYMSRGLHLLDSDAAVISGNVIKTNTVDATNWYIGTIALGIYTERSSYLNITDNDIMTRMRGGSAVYQTYGSNNNVSNNVITVHGADTRAVSFVRSPSAIARGNTITTTDLSSSPGIAFSIFSDNGIAENNTITAQGGVGVTVNSAANVVVRDNRIVGRGDLGVFTDVGDTNISGNTR